MNPPKYQIDELRKMEKDLMDEGLPRYRIHELLGQKLGGLSRSTLYRWLTPGQYPFSP